MKIALIVPDNSVIIDDKGLMGLDLSSLSKKNIYSFHWDEDHGKIAYNDGTIKEVATLKGFLNLIEDFNKKIVSKIEQSRISKIDNAVWDDKNIRWVPSEKLSSKDLEIKISDEKKNFAPGKCFVWDDTANDWILDDICLALKQSKNYLKSTDWYYVRQIETGEVVPDEVIIRRREAREYIRENDPSQQS